MFSSSLSSSSGTPLTSTSLLNTSTRRGLHATSRGTPGLANRSVRAEQALKETAHHVVKALNSPVPVQVQELLRGDLSAVSVKLHMSGWAWLVCGRTNRVLLWRYGPVQAAVASCIQLGLPSPTHSNGWNADLITTCGELSSNFSLFAAAPGGRLHYWGNVLREQSAPSVNGTVDVGTGHVIMATPILGDTEVILFTSEGCLFRVHLPSPSQPLLTGRVLHVTHGLLSGFSRKVSSLFFGSSSATGGQRAEGRGVAIRELEGGISHVFVLVTTSLMLLQKWIIEDGREQMVYEASLDSVISASVVQKDWFKGQQVSLAVWSVDVGLVQDYAVVLFAVRVDGSAVAEYGLALFDSHCDSAPISPDHLIQLNHKISYQSDREECIYSLSLQSAPTSPSVTVHDRNTLLLSIASSEEAVTDVVNFPSSTAILGTGHLEGRVVLFTTSHGVISIHLTSPLSSLPPHAPTASSSQTVSSSLLLTPTVTSSLSSRRHPVALSPEAVAEGVEKLKDAFLEYLEGNITEASVSAHQLFSAETYSGGYDRGDGSTIDGLGDVAVKRLSEMVLNDQPMQDPRWGDARAESLTGGSLIIIYQLENKQTAHLRLLQFLGDCGILKKLSCVTERGQVMRTTDLLCEHAEKITAAIALRKAHNQVLDQAMKVCVSKWSSAPAVSLRPGLSHQDLFYTEVVRLGDIFPSLLSLVQSRLQSLSNPKERLQLVLGACSAVDEMLREAVQYRRTKASLYAPPLPPDPTSLPPFIPWTSSAESSGVRNSLSQLLDILYDDTTRDAGSQQEVWRVAVGMTDVLLGGYLDQIQSMEQNQSLTTELAQVRKQFEAARARFLSPLLEHGQYDSGIELAERYQDFQLLVQLCERAGDRERLKSYVVRFEEQGFAEFLFKQHLDQGKIQELLSYSEDFPQQLAKFLKPHDHISWLHQVATQDYSAAHSTLYSLAHSEEKFVARKKTRLSLSKLALLCSGTKSGNGDMIEVNRQLSIIEHQRNIPDSVLEAVGMDMETMPPLPPADIVQLYVGEKNESADELDFLHALELLRVAFEDKTCDEFIDLRTYLWSQAALRDNWSQMSTDNPLDQLPRTLLFRIIQTAFYREFDLGDLLPTVEALLTSPSLLDAGVAQDTQFRFLVSAGFEQLERLQSSL